MKINEVCKKTGLTKKAIEYYQLKNLFTPEVLSNGYRDFSERDVHRLKEVALLRKLGLSIMQIRSIFESEHPEQILYRIKKEKQIELELKSEKLKLLDALIRGQGLVYVDKQLSISEKQLTIKEKLTQAFPGFYGQLIAIHFEKFLGDCIETDEQEEAYKLIVHFLDNMESPLIPEEIQKELETAFELWTDENFLEVERNQIEALEDIDSFWESNRSTLKDYAEFKNSEEYESSTIGQTMTAFRSFGESSGYFDEFLPAMRRLSPSYAQYCNKLATANTKLNQKMSENNILR